MPFKPNSNSVDSKKDSQSAGLVSSKEDDVKEAEISGGKRSNRVKKEPLQNNCQSELDVAKEKLENSRNTKFMESDISSEKVRIRLTSLHPMLESDYFIDTSDTDNFYNVVFDHVFARKSGLYITGEFRVGKSKNIVNTISRLKTDMPIIYAASFSGTRNLNQSKSSFCQEILTSLKYHSSSHQNSIVALPRYLIANSVMAGSRTCVLFVDEAQMLTVIQLRYLLEIWNDLRREGFLLVTVLVGQTNLDYLMQLTEEQDQGAVIARFFVNRFSLGGLHTKEGLERYLSAYDNMLFYPIGSNWSYSRFFRNMAFDAGWRLESEAERFWNILMERSRTNSISLRKNGFRLAFINDAIHSFLIDSMKKENLSEKAALELWGEAVSSAASNELLIGYADN